MGMCCSCYGDDPYEQVDVDPDIRRNLLLEAAEKRRKEAESRGLKNPDELKRKEQRMKEAERIADERARQYGNQDNTLKWQLD